MDSGAGRSDLFQAGALLSAVHHRRRARPRGAGLWLEEGITHRSHRVTGRWRPGSICAPSSTPTPGRAASRAVIAFGAGARSALTPYGAGQFTTFDLPAYMEQAHRPAPTRSRWTTARKSVTDSRSELGLRTDRAFAMPDGVLTLRGAQRRLGA